MLAAFSEGSHTVTATHVKSAAQDSEFNKGGVSGKKITIASAVILLIAGVLIAGIYIGKQGSPEQSLVEVVPPAVVPQHEISASATRAAPSAETVDKVVPGKISERIAKTQQWLSVAADNNFSIQLFMARSSDADKVEAFLMDVPETLDFTKIYIYETVINGRAWYSVLYNDFTTQDDAIAKLDELPASLKASDPYLRRISALKKDVAR
jgi:septal ring-binding cell division protein DamX